MEPEQPLSLAPTGQPNSGRSAKPWSLAGWVRKFQEVTRVTVAVVVLLFVLYGVGMHFKHQVRDGVHWRYWLEVFTSNWNPEQPSDLTKQNNDFIGNQEYMAGTVLALLVNLGSFVLIFGTLRGIWKIERRRKMDTKEAYLLRDIDLENDIYKYVRKLTPEFYNSAANRQKLRNDIKTIFDDAREHFLDNIKAAYGAEGQKYVETHPDEFRMQ